MVKEQAHWGKFPSSHLIDTVIVNIAYLESCLTLSIKPGNQNTIFSYKK